MDTTDSLPVGSGHGRRPLRAVTIGVWSWLGVVAVVLSACSSTSSGPATSTSTALTTGKSSTSTISTATKAGVGTVLVSVNGHTAYRLTTDTADRSTCTGPCAQLWPPVTVPAGSRPTAPSGLTGTLGTITRADGSTQVTYDGEPIYVYSLDTATGDALGQGVGGVWFTVKPAGSGSTPPSTTTSTTARSGGYGY
jgi:predicted lipoprotein with Yx(FWY)xxD motif